jgi:hypothetical protein
MSAANRVALWAEVSKLLVDYENSTQAEVKEAIAKSYDSLRQRLQVVALDTADPEEMT